MGVPRQNWRGARGFTLVELMVSLALLGLVMTVVFSLFSTTSDGLKEADSLASTVDRARFAVEQVTRDVKNAGAFSTPDSRRDGWVIEEPNMCVVGVASYDGWQNPSAWFEHEFFGQEKPPADLLQAHTTDNDTVAIGYDGFILMGAIDAPQTFEVVDVVVAGASSTVTVPNFGRGVLKLLRNDLFNVEVEPVSENALRDSFVKQLSARLLRVADRDGNLQFSEITEAVDNGENGVSLSLERAFQVRSSTVLKGLEPQSRDSQDVGYEAALIDAFWYRVEPDPADTRNFRLVRYRLDAGALSGELCDPDQLSQADLEGLARVGNAWIEKSVIADRVADFQVWFDCADAEGNVAGAAWPDFWANPNGAGLGSGQNDGCMDPANPNFGAARMAHMRLSLRTRDERKDAPVEMFLDENGAFDASLPLRYFDLYPDAPGAARVVTVQTDIELSTFGMRNIPGVVAAPPPTP